VAQSKNCPFRVNITTELKNITATGDNNGIWLDVFRLGSVPVLWDVVVTFFSSAAE
jgi:hypothetical protein